MKLNKKLENEIWKIYDIWMQGYLNADVETYNLYFDEDYHFIGSTNNEEFLNRKDTTEFFRATGDQFAGMTDLRKETKTLEVFGEHVFLTHFFDAWFKNDEDWSYYGRFRFSSVMHQTKEGWRFIYQHFSMPDSKSEEGETIGFDKVHLENQELREAIQRRTKELEEKNRELEVETALERIRAQAVAMKASTDLLDIVVTMRNEFIKLGHEAHYFWHMMWLPEIYEKAMTSGDGTKIGFVMKLPRHIHGDIPLLAKWEKSKKPTVVYAMNVDEALDYVNKMITLGDFQNIDPQAPTEEDVRHIGGLTFIMARTTHGEIGYSLPGVVKNPPKEDIDILVKFAGAFDLAHQRFLDLQKAEAQARETQIELALEKVRSRTMAMQHSDELNDVVKAMFENLKELQIPNTAVGIAVRIENSKDLNAFVCGENKKGLVITNYRLPYFKNKICNDLNNTLEKQLDYYVGHYSKKEKNAFYKYLIEHTPEFGNLPNDIKHMIFDSLTYTISMVASKHSIFNINDFEGKELSKNNADIIKRFAKVFEHTYTRFLDLQKAEAQARETQIELALEKVRSRTMAMQKSKELADVATVLFQQVKELGIEQWTCGFNIWESGDTEFTFYPGGPDGEILPSCKVPLMEHPIFRQFDESKRRGDELFVYEKQGEVQKDHYKYMHSLPGIGDMLQGMLDSGLEFPEYQIDHVANFAYGNMIFITYQPVPEMHGVFKRFAKVFEQTYTRFLDLQKAEAQAREAQIETALEKVRSRTMAMQKGEEIKDVVVLLYKELIALGVTNFATCGYVEINENTSRQETWVTSPGGDSLGLFYLPLTGDIHFDERYEAWKKQQTVFHQTVAGKERKKHLEYAITTFNSKEAEEMVLNQFPDPTVFYCFNFSHGYLHLVSGSYLNEEEKSLLARFTRVFEQTYARFLDLQKAEAQARESQIQLALERVRARTMAMQNSNELVETSELLFEQIKDLGIEVWSCGYSLWYDDDSYFIGYNPMPNGKMGPTFKIPLTEDIFFKTIRKAKREGQEFLIFESKGKSLEKTYQYMDTLPVVGEAMRGIVESGFELPKFQVTHCGFFTHGHLMFITHKHYPEAHDIFKRFTKEFEQTYTRFLDLQKAEAQVREAQIEAALERVRSRSMAMHKSEEIGDVAFVLFEQLKGLGGELWGTGFGFCKKNSTVDEFWFANENGIMPHLKIPNNVDEAHKKMYQGWKKNLESFSIAKGGKELKDHYKYMLTVPDVKPIFQGILDNGITFPKWQKWHAAYFKYGYLLVITTENYENENVFVRFAKVFEQAYTRFLDLQKAEAQARESQIELGLERVRARAMAMQKSNELSDLVSTVMNELTKLDFALALCIINIINGEDRSNTVWAANPEVSDYPESYYLKFEDHKFHHGMWKAWKERKEKWVYTIEGSEKEIYQEYLFNETEFKRFSKKAQKEFKGLKKWVASFTFSSFGGLQTVGEKPLSEENLAILARFGKVFDLTYTRFNDLQKAEAQAREAQIEMALEKVRSRTMAMQHSDELPQAANTLFLEIQGLGMPSWSCGFNILSEDKTTSQSWMSSEGEIQKPFNLVFKKEASFIEMYNFFKSDATFLIQELDGKAIERHYNYLKSLPGLDTIFGELEKNKIPLPTYQINHLCKFNQGYLLFITYEKVPEAHNIFKRFTKVFEQTYTRFLDLQKAEAQARESQIELGLERVRARAMAMQHSNELSDIVATVLNELTKLDFSLTWCIINIINEADHSNMIWAINPEGGTDPESYYMKFEDYPYHHATIKAWKAKKTKFVYILEGKEKKIYDDYLYNETEFKRFSNKAKKANRALDRYVASFTFNSFGGLQTISSEPLSDENLEILERFGKVFDMTYTRFNDLQKAEAQAREAQIEAALERVRAASMAMHKSEDLLNIVKTLYGELESLNINTDIVGIRLNKDNSKDLYFWMFTVDGLYDKLLYWPYQDLRIFHEINNSQVSGEVMEMIFSKAETKEFFREYFKLDSVPQERRAAVQKMEVMSWLGSFLPHTGLFIMKYLNETYSSEERDIVKRFAKVFEQTYTRFLDLQKAEAQTRQAQINLAVERVRAKALAMHKSEEIMEVVAKLKDEVMGLDIPNVVAATIFLNEGEDKVRMWDLSSLEKDNNGYQIPFDITFKLKKRDPNLYIKRVWENQDNYFLEKQEAKDFKRIVAWLKENNKNEVADEVEEFIETTKLKRLHHAVKKLNNGKLAIDLLNPPSDEMEAILTKMGAAFDLAYKRFEDLQKAETQTREAQIEFSLERVRSQAMAMRKSEDLVNCTSIVFDELEKLNLPIERSGIGIFNKENKDCQLWTIINNQDGIKELATGVTSLTLHPMLKETFNAWENQKPYSHVLEGKELEEYYNLVYNSKFVLPEELIKKSTSLLKEYYHYSPFGAGGLYFFSDSEPVDEDKLIIRRFAEVFDLTYTRYEDLQKAEAQAREAQIETALERVRSRSMAMHNSEELKEVIQVVYDQFVQLNINIEHAGFILDYKENDDMHIWLADHNAVFPKIVLPYFDCAHWNSFIEAKKKRNDFFTNQLGFEEKNKFYKDLFQFIPDLPEETKTTYFKFDGLAISTVLLDNVGLYIENYSGTPFSDEENEILMRFGKVFQQTYTRFLDLKKAEAQTREAQIETALEKVRSRTMAMQHSNELPEAANNLFLQVQALGIPAWSAGYCIWEDKQKTAWCNMSSEGEIQKGFSLPTIGEGYNFYKPFKNNEAFHVAELGGEKLVKHYDFMKKLPIVGEVLEEFDKKGITLPTFQIFHIVYFTHGYLMFITYEAVPNQWDIFKRFGNVFEQTYTRFLDLKLKEDQAVKLEKEKQRLEKTLKDLQATQNQLIQSEKMASLGELTAGIAHEIQNPLNFVNNFSEVSKELLDEMLEEIANGDMEEVKAIMDDVIQNLEKINHHGKRADGIVKGMLQHSRATGDKKEPTNINNLADEYMRLAYHGLRAKDKSFNATLDTNFDEKIETIHVIPQDIGRVILNLFTNAFYAVDEKKKSGVENYAPTVSVSTKLKNNHVEISVKDNGNGIPKKVLDKIFQPFFTTKPTGQGTGLGLSMSYDIITKGHGGELKVETKKGEGTTFRITLPNN